MGFLSFIHNFSHRQEILESRDEMLMGELITVMAELGYPVIGLRSNADYQRIQFLTLKDPVLHSVVLTLDRKTGGITGKVIGNKATLTIQAEVKNYLADPDDVLEMYRTDLANILRMPILGQTKINHQFNSVIATTTRIIDIDRLLESAGGRPELQQTLQSLIADLREKIARYKKPSALEPEYPATAG